MELVRGKIKKTGEIVVLEKILKNEETAYFSIGRMLGAAEVEILEELLKPRCYDWKDKKTGLIMTKTEKSQIGD